MPEITAKNASFGHVMQHAAEDGLTFLKGAVPGVVGGLAAAGGAEAGAAVGATIGTAVAPGPGTLLGGALGGIVGATGTGLLAGAGAGKIARMIPTTHHVGKTEQTVANLVGGLGGALGGIAGGGAGAAIAKRVVGGIPTAVARGAGAGAIVRTSGGLGLGRLTPGVRVGARWSPRRAAGAFGDAARAMAARYGPRTTGPITRMTSPTWAAPTPRWVTGTRWTGSPFRGVRAPSALITSLTRRGAFDAADRIPPAVRGMMGAARAGTLTRYQTPEMKRAMLQFGTSPAALRLQQWAKLPPVSARRGSVLAIQLAQRWRRAAYLRTARARASAAASWSPVRLHRTAAALRRQRGFI